jgi:hypothetical protein
MRMTRQHFQFIAETVSDIPAPTIRWLVANLFADRLSSTNNRFDRNRFMQHCQAEEPVKTSPKSGTSSLH